ncbi:hypothetical protein FRC01_000650 [Tulasnella sp. 417]|nr:hypothetical protein FRC01_000650 [Tulasnella sp. 417]
MSNPESCERILLEAIAGTEDFDAEEVANAVPGLGLAPDMQAALIRTWDSSFAAEVLQRWTPGDETWLEFLESSKDDIASLSFMLTVFTAKEVRGYISTIGGRSSPTRLAQLMKAFGAAKLSSFIPPTAKTLSTTPLPLHSKGIVQPPNPSPTLPSNGDPNQTQSPVDLSKGSDGLPSAASHDQPPTTTDGASQNAAQEASPVPQVSPPPKRLTSWTIGFHIGYSSVASTGLDTPIGRRPGKPSPSPPPGDPDEDFLPPSSHSDQRTCRQSTPHPSPSPHEKSDDEFHQVPAPNKREAQAFPVRDSGSGDLAYRSHSSQRGSHPEAKGDATGGALTTTDGAHEATDGQEVTIPEGLDDGLTTTDDEEPSTEEEDDDGLNERTVEDEMSEGGVDRALNPWAWSQKTNDEKVRKWELEDLIKVDRLSTAAARTKWMYEARLGKLDEEEYAERRAEETKAFIEIPPACRDAIGMVFYKDSKLDWEIRVYLAPPMYKYVLYKVDEEEAAKKGDDTKVQQLKEKRTALLDSTMDKLFVRFPDCSPDHPLRQIKKRVGSKLETKYVNFFATIQSFRNKFTSDAGRMKRSYLKSLGKNNPSPAKVSTSALLEILGRKRAHIAFHLWGGSESGGKTICDIQIEKELDDWKKKHPTAKPTFISHRRITIVHSVRFKLFEKQTEEVRNKWAKRAKALHIPKTPEEEKCLVDAALPYVLELLELLAERGDMHFVLFAAGKGSYNIPIVMQEFSRNGPDNLAFLFTDEGLGTRMKPEYIAYARNRFDGDDDDAELGLPGVDFKLDEEAEEASVKASNKDGVGRKAISSMPQESYVAPFQPDQSSVKKVAQMRKAISEWIISSIQKLHASRATWDKITQSPHVYIDVERMPMDPEYPNQRLQLQRPSSMSEIRVKTLFKFLIESYNGDLPADQAFRWKHESRHLQVPSPAVPEDPSVHHAAAAAAKTKVRSGRRAVTEPKARKGQQVKKAALETCPEDEDFQDWPGLMEDNDAALLNQALGRGVDKPSASNSRKSRKLQIDTPPESDSSTTDELPQQPPATEGVSKQRDQSQSDTSRPKPRPMSILNSGSDELVHKRFVPGSVEDSAVWAKLRATLAEWGQKMIRSAEEVRTMPYLGMSGVRHDVRVPNGLHAAFSILQLWNAYQMPFNTPDVTLNPMSGLEELHAHHHVTVIVKEISNPLQPLPSAKQVYDQLLISEDANDALFLQLESAISVYIDQMVASEESILEADLDLLKAFRIIAFVRASGWVRDLGGVGSITLRTSALTDRFVAVLAGIAFARYMKVVLTRVAKLYLEESQEDDLRSMWKQLLLVWDIGCKSLARTLVHRRSDNFSLERLRPMLPKNFSTLLSYAFVERPWWTPGDEGAPGPLKILNKQAVAIEPFFKMLETVPWTQLGLIERGQVLLLIFLAAIQIQTGRVSINRFAEVKQPISKRLAESLEKLAKIIQESSEMGPTEDPIIIPLEDAAPHIDFWIEESRVSRKLATEGAPDAQVGGERIPGEGEEDSAVSSSPQGDLPVSDYASHKESCGSPEISHATASSILPPEEEDPTLPRGTLSTLHQTATATEASQNPSPSTHPVEGGTATNDDVPPSTIPAVRSLDDASLPSRKKQKLQDVRPLPSRDGATAGRILRSAAKQPAEPSNLPSASTANEEPIVPTMKAGSGSNDQGEATAQGEKGGPKTRSRNKKSGPAESNSTRQTPKRSGTAKGLGSAARKAKGTSS